MDFSAIGGKIKELRKLLGLSQKELAEGICTQAQISKIEKGDVYPYASTLYLISQRLGVDVNYFFDIGTTPRLDYVKEVSRQLVIARRKLDYEEVKQIVQTEEKNPLFSQNRRNFQLLLWHKGIYIYHMTNNVKKAISLFEEAIGLTHDKIWTERELEILISKGIIYFEEGHLEIALQLYELAQEQLNHLPHIQDGTIKTRLYYNIARVLTRLGRYSRSITYCKEAIDWCIENEDLFLLAELHYHIGYNYELLEDIPEAKSFMEKSLIIFELQLDTKYITFIKSKIENWSGQLA
ncbi:helix-turn-helix transcriptional regulator [Cytobacillus sp. NCCP-133]|uniref:helix-turn-helix transcriptional regulator n=1 Tax=Cytobacillus sp. NCCP-133 TaxID=766848 RepID=UPI002231B6C3|nr:helix-turn-helix transcriptional regulator [Cytobacillus sp. NCCP-133]GLB60215.1 transcriptional regulator [Cytobacillus sp. NCCP-133]